MFTLYNPGHEFQDELYGCYHANSVPFDIEKKDWKRVKNIKDAQFIAINGQNITPENIQEKIELIKNLNLEPHQKLLMLFIWHIDNKIRDKDHYRWIRGEFKQIPNELAIIHTNFANDEEIQYDWLWNRQKIYFTNYNYIDLKGRTYTHDTDANTFQLTHIAKTPMQQNVEVKHYLSPIRIYSQMTHPRFQYRKKLKELLTKHSDKGYYSDIESGNILTCENNILPFRVIGGGWYPIANKFYNTTILSTYVETITGTYPEPGYEDVKYKSITEKTWDPLIKGHFILPFAYPGFIEHLKTYGFLLPDWIDYSYDSIENDEERFIAFTKSLENFFEYGTHEILQFFYNGRDILNHNRMVFWDRPYDSLYQKVKNYFKM